MALGGNLMPQMLMVIQIFVALGLLNVWLFRFRRATPYRGGSAASMPAEFAAYGLPSWFMVVIGTLKVSAAIALIAGVWYPRLIFPASLLIATLMLGALAMHAKVRDPLQKYLPAVGMLVLSSMICFAAS